MKRVRTKKTNLGTNLVFEEIRPKDFPRGARAYVHKGFVVRPDPRERAWRVDKLSMFGPETAVPGFYTAPEHAAFALEGWLARGERELARPNVDLMFGAIAEVARALLAGKLALVSSESNVAVRATV